MSTLPRTVPFFTLSLADAQLQVVHLRRRRAELARDGALWRCRWAVALALVAAHAEVLAFGRLAHRLEGTPGGGR